jgi:hypothetical protein
MDRVIHGEPAAGGLQHIVQFHFDGFIIHGGTVDGIGHFE